MFSYQVTYFITLIQFIVSDVVLITTALLIFPYRMCVYISARMLKPHLKLIDTGIIQMFCQPHIGNNFFPNTASAVVTVAGNIDVEDFRKLFNQRILQNRHKDGSHSFRLFQSTIESYMGYWFWTDEINFNLNQHIRTHNVEKEYSACDKNFLEEILAQLSKQPWNKNRSPWEITLTSCKNSQTLLIIRWHHCLADGLSMAKAMRILMESEITFTNENNKICKGLQISPKYIASIPRDTAKARNWSFETIPHVKETLHKGASFTKPFPIEAIKRVMSRHGVSCQAVFSTAASSAMQRGLEECGQPVPKYVLSYCPLKAPDHPDHMMNDFLPGYLPMLVECSTLKTRLMKTEKHFKDIKKSKFSVGVYFRIHVASILPTSLRNLFLAWNMEKGTVYVGNFPWCGKMTLLGNDIVDVKGTIDSIPGSVDMSVLAIGYNNQISFGVTANNGFPIDSERQCKYLELELEKIINLE